MEHLSEIPTAVNMADWERRDWIMISETFDTVYKLALEIEATPETQDKLEQVKSTMLDLKHVLNRRRDNRVYQLDI